MVDVIRWPSLLKALRPKFELRGQTVGGPVSLTGTTQVASIDAGYWVATIDVRLLSTPAGIKALRKLKAQMAGGAHHCRVPVFDEPNVPWPASGGVSQANDDLPFDDDETFDDGTGFYDPVILVTAAEAAAQGATQLVADVATAGEITGGEYLSIADQLYEIVDVIDESGSQQTWQIAPRLREAIIAGVDIEMQEPACRMRLRTEESADAAIDFGVFAQPTIEFVEAFQ